MIKNKQKMIMTLCCVYNDSQILLGRIMKNGVLKDRYNGFGGKLEKSETIEQAAHRELEEEAGIKALDLTKRGLINFIFEETGNPFVGKPEIELHIFSAIQYAGIPIETEEMLPIWFNHSQIPYSQMWADDIYWLPLLLAGKNFVGTFFLKDPHTITKFELKEVTELI